MRRESARMVSIVVIGVFLLNGCTSWRGVATTDLEKDQKDVRLFLANGTKVDVKNAYVRGDSLFGTAEESGWDVPASYAMADVLKIKEMKFSLAKTAGATGGLAVVLWLAAAGLLALAGAAAEGYGAAMNSFGGCCS